MLSMPSIKITRNDLPASYRVSSQASGIAQKQFLILTASNLGLLVIAAIVGSLAWNSNPEKIILATISAILLTISVFLTITIRLAKLEQMWYDGRAVAESIKTAAWRYMTGSDPYPINLGTQADSLFLFVISSLLKDRKTFAARLGGKIILSHR
jgi:hypothetical protein